MATKHFSSKVTTFLILMLVALFAPRLSAQYTQVDSLVGELSRANTDTAKIKLSIQLVYHLKGLNRDSALLYCQYASGVIDQISSSEVKAAYLLKVGKGLSIYPQI